MRINNYLLNEILYINDVSAIDILFHLLNDYAKIPEKQLFNSIFFLKGIGKATSNNSYMSDKMKTMLSNFIWTDKINCNEVVFEFKAKYIELFSAENLKRNYTDIDVSIIYNLHSLHSKKLYIYFEMNKYKINQKINYTEISMKELRTGLNIAGIDLTGNFLRLITRFFSDIKKIIPSYEFKISYKKQSRKIISLLCFFNEKPEIKINDFEVKTEFIPEAKEPEAFTETFIPTPKIEPQQTKIENVINYRPEIKKEVVNQYTNNNDKELIEMDAEDIEARFANIENLINMKNIVNDSEVKENIQMSVPKEVVPKIEVKEEIKVDENLSIPEQIYNFFVKDYRGFEHRFENMKVIFDSKNKKAIINFKDEPFNVEWSVNNKVDKHYQKAIAFVTKEMFKVEIK